MTDNGKTITYSDLSPKKRHVNTFDFFTLKLLWILLLCAVSFLLSATASFAKLENTELAEFGLMLHRQVFHVTSEADSGPGSLRDILETMASDDVDGEARFRVETVIYFDVPGGVIKPKTPFPRITSNTNFIGPVSFDMSETSPVPGASLRSPISSIGDLFYIERVNCVFHNISFLNAQGVRPIYYEGGSGVFANCVFFHNITENLGGAVYQSWAMLEGWSALTFTRCSFIENTAETGGGAICSQGNLTLLDCVFEDNVAGKYGVSLSSYSNDPLSTRRTRGGAVYGRYVNAIGCTFKNNQVVYLREKSEISSNDVTVETSELFMSSGRLQPEPDSPYSLYIGVSYLKETIAAQVMLNIKNCTIIERK